MVAPNQYQPVDPSQPPAPGSLEPLSQEESRFLTQYFRDFREDLLAWSAAINIAIDALAKWLNHPRIAAYVAALRHHQAQAAKRKCLDVLNAIIDSDEPLPEKRRAATTLLRAIAPASRDPSRCSIAASTSGHPTEESIAAGCTATESTDRANTNRSPFVGTTGTTGPTACSESLLCGTTQAT